MQYFSILSIYIYMYVCMYTRMWKEVGSSLSHWQPTEPDLVLKVNWLMKVFEWSFSDSKWSYPQRDVWSQWTKEVSATPMHPNGWRRSRFSSPSSCGMGPWATRFTTIADGCLPHRKSPRQSNGGTWQMEIFEITLIYLQNSTVFPYFHLPRLPRISC